MSRACDQCGSTRGTTYIPDPECAGVHAWWACEPCRGADPVANLTHLERLVQAGCEAIYREREGYWPSDMERHHIAIALVEQAVYPGRSGGSDV